MSNRPIAASLLPTGPFPAVAQGTKQAAVEAAEYVRSTAASAGGIGAVCSGGSRGGGWAGSGLAPCKPCWLLYRPCSRTAGTVPHSLPGQWCLAVWKPDCPFWSPLEAPRDV